jgi:hypothetical protein
LNNREAGPDAPRTYGYGADRGIAGREPAAKKNNAAHRDCDERR